MSKTTRMRNPFDHYLRYLTFLLFRVSFFVEEMRSRNHGWELCRSDEQLATQVTEHEQAAGHCEIFNWFRCWEPAAAFPIDRRECDRRTEFPGHPVGSLAVCRRRFKGNRHAVIGGSRSFRVLGAGFVLKRGCVAICPTLQLEHRSCGQFEHSLQKRPRRKRYSRMLNARPHVAKKNSLLPTYRKFDFLNHVRASASYDQYVKNKLINEFFAQMCSDLYTYQLKAKFQNVIQIQECQSKLAINQLLCSERRSTFTMLHCTIDIFAMYKYFQYLLLYE